MVYFSKLLYTISLYYKYLNGGEKKDERRRRQNKIITRAVQYVSKFPTMLCVLYCVQAPYGKMKEFATYVSAFNLEIKKRPSTEGVVIIKSRIKQGVIQYIEAKYVKSSSHIIMKHSSFDIIHTYIKILTYVSVARKKKLAFLADASAKALTPTPLAVSGHSGFMQVFLHV